MSVPQITAFGSVPMPTSLMPGGSTWLGPMVVFVFDPVGAFIYAASSYNDNLGHPFAILSKIDRTTNTIVWNVTLDRTTFPTHAVTDGTNIYVSIADFTNSPNVAIQKRLCSDGSLVSTSSITTNLRFTANPGFLRMKTISSVQYVALAGGNSGTTAGLFVIRTDTMATVLNIADVLGIGNNPWGPERANFDNSGNLWLGSFGGFVNANGDWQFGITNISLTSNVLTVTCDRSTVGMNGAVIRFSGLTTSTYLNGQIKNIASVVGSTFTVNFTHANDASHADTGTAAIWPGNDLVKVTVPGGVITVYPNVWPEITPANGNFFEIADNQFYDPTDNTLVIGDENRPWRKISLNTNPPSQLQVMEAEYPNNLYQSQSTLLTDSTNQEGFGANGTEKVLIQCLGGATDEFVILFDHTNTLASVTVIGQRYDSLGNFQGPLFSPINDGTWIVDATADNTADMVLDNTANNPHSGGLTIWTYQPSADPAFNNRSTRWEWFDISLGVPIRSGAARLIGGNFQDALGNPVAEGVLAIIPPSNLRVGQICDVLLVNVLLDSTGNVVPGSADLLANSVLQDTDGYYVTRLKTADGQPCWDNTVVVSGTGSTTDITDTVPVTTPLLILSPALVSVVDATTKQFTATIMNLANTAVIWSVDGIVGGIGSGSIRWINPTVALIAVTDNNTSASSSYAADASSNAAAGNVSRVSIKNSLAGGTKAYIETQHWFAPGNAHTIDIPNIGYDSTGQTQINAQVNECVARGYDGEVFDWYFNDAVSKATGTKIRTAAESQTGYEFAMMIDVGGITDNASINANIIAAFQYINDNYSGSSAYMKRSGRPVVFEFGLETLTNTPNWGTIRAAVSAMSNGNPLIIWQNQGGLDGTSAAGAQADGGYAWPQPTLNAAAQLAYINNFYTAAIANPAKHCFGGGWKGFNGALASWHPPGVITQNNGATWKSYLDLAKLKLPSVPLANFMTDTLDDYEEGTETETGIASGFAFIATGITGSLLSWAHNGVTGVIDHFAIYISADGVNEELLGTAASSALSFQLPNNLSSGGYLVYVQAVGISSVQNVLSPIQSYSVPSASGTIDVNGLYTAPSVDGDHVVTATSKAVSTLSASAIVHVIHPVITVSLSPSSATIAASATRQFTATVTGTGTATVTWQVDGVSGGNSTVGTVSATGLYTAPVTAGSHVVKATSTVDITKNASSTVSVTATAVTVSVAPHSVALNQGQTQTFVATVAGNANHNVTWYVDNIAGGNSTVGTISGVGLYTAPASSTNHSIKAVSVVDTNVSDTATVTMSTSAQSAVPMDYVSACVIGPGQGWGLFPTVGNLYSDRIWDAGMDYFLTATNPFSVFSTALDKWIVKFRTNRTDLVTSATYRTTSMVTVCGRNAWGANNLGGAWTANFLNNIWQPFITQLCNTYGAGKAKDATDVIEGFEIWNEADAGGTTGCPGGNTAQCVQNWIALAKIAAPLMRAAGFKTFGPCPQSAAHDSTGFIYQLGLQGGGQYLDGITRHHYRSLPETVANYLSAEIKLCQQFGDIAGKPWYVTEVNSNTAIEQSEDVGIAYIQRLYILSWILGQTAAGVQILKRVYWWGYDGTGITIDHAILTNNAIKNDPLYPSTPNGGETVVAKAWGAVDGTTASGKVWKSLQRKLVGTKLLSVSVDASLNYTVNVVYAGGATGTITWNGADLTNANAIPAWS